MAAAPDFSPVLEQIPNADKQGRLVGPDPNAGDKLFFEIVNNGREYVLQLIGLLGGPAKPDDWKIRYLLHGLAVYVGRQDNRRYHNMFVEAVVSQLESKLPKDAIAFLIGEVQVSGGKEAVPVLGRFLLDPVLYEPAAEALVAIREGAAEQFRAALPKATGKIRLVVLQALGVLRDAQSAALVRPALSDPERDVRLAAAFALANFGDAASIEALIQATAAENVYERDQTVAACLLLAERLTAAGRKDDAKRIYERLRAAGRMR